MKNLLIPTLLILSACTAVVAQTPKNHVFYDTVKMVKERIDFSPDTIPVYFKELVMQDFNNNEVPAYEVWRSGYVIWQTYRKYGIDTTAYIAVGMGITAYNGGWYKQPYEPSKPMVGTYLYSDRKTVVKNKVIYSINK